MHFAGKTHIFVLKCAWNPLALPAVGGLFLFGYCR